MKEKKVLIINPFGIGDVLFSTPLIKNIKISFPDSKIYYLCNRRVYPALINNPLIEKIFVYERDEFEAVKVKSKILWLKKLYSFFKEIKKEKIDIAIDLSLNSQFGFFAKLAGIKERVGYDYKKRGRFLTKKFKFSGYKNKHIIEYYLDLAEKLGFLTQNKEMSLILSDKQKETAEVFLKNHNIIENDLYIAISPCGGASWGKDSYLKHWSKSKFGQLADKLIKNYNAKIILTGSKGEEKQIDEIASLMEHKPIKAVGLPLMDYAAILSKAKILITNDGGPLHVGVALGIKTISLFGPVDDLVYGPYPLNTEKHSVIKKDLLCRPCYNNFRLTECKFSKKCLENIEVEEVFEEVKRLLNLE